MYSFMHSKKRNKRINFFYGLGDKPSDYGALSKYLNIIKIDWNNPGSEKVPQCDTVVGFSMGCFLALDYAEKHRIKKLVLCSLPVCENVGPVKADEIIFLVGEKEKWILKEINRVRKSMKSRSQLFMILGAKHKITGNYRKKLLEVIGN
ncbi:MAG: hypothetical protein A3F53_00955 [Candidatus Zambryskibacteria bacterium RIFCSPHIGHO2_12_FULL_48_10]|nr:MAG: hypothetical protein A3F53_00955 [Candidatus Zambryskibacteria bacterium RIFCSPHIGHO2_12_FULL_48_10]